MFSFFLSECNFASNRTQFIEDGIQDVLFCLCTLLSELYVRAPLCYCIWLCSSWNI